MSDKQGDLPPRRASSRDELVQRTVDALSSPLEWKLEHFGHRFRNMLLPSRHKVIQCVENLRSVLFPGYFGYREFREDTIQHHVGAELDRTAYTLQEEIRHAVRFVADGDYERNYARLEDVEGVVDDFIECLPAVRRRLVADAQSCFEWDPAVFIPEAPVFCYPNMQAMINYRLAHELYIRGVPFIPRIITEHAHSL